ncbi:hypothetical protein HZC35_05210 [Candidatus Saganbacteria bacterium]|nr:hypothetical protein [Candidatus Saganbacteria bacterium]
MSPSKGRLTPIQILVLGYAAVTLAGAFLLSLPISNSHGVWQPFIDSLFVATSGISTSGLSPVDIGTYYTLFGQLVLMSIFQIGGIGYMTFIIFIAYLLGEKISVWTGMVARESLATRSYDWGMLGNFFRNVLFYTFLFEFVGAMILAVFWMREYSLARSLYLGVFHSISAFCTAGFALFPSSLMNWRSSPTLNMTVNIISLIGGIGFFVLMDIFGLLYKRWKKLPGHLSLHSKLALWVTLAVIVIGATVIFSAEKWPADLNLADRLWTSTFQSISASTTDGFNTLDIGAMSAASLTMLIVLMFIGASPGSTGGGIKTTTLGAIFVSVGSYLKGRRRVRAFEREFPLTTVLRAFTIFALFILILLVDLIVLGNVERASYLQLFFEITSALGNTGLSMGITSALTSLGKAMLIITMFIGRVGPVTIAMSFLAKPTRESLRFPEEDIFVG